LLQFVNVKVHVLGIREYTVPLGAAGGAHQPFFAHGAVIGLAVEVHTLCLGGQGALLVGGRAGGAHATGRGIYGIQPHNAEQPQGHLIGHSGMEAHAPIGGEVAQPGEVIYLVQHLDMRGHDQRDLRVGLGQGGQCVEQRVHRIARMDLIRLHVPFLLCCWEFDPRGAV
jgi:hypothetical protein